MYSRSRLVAIRLRLSSQIRRISEPSTSREPSFYSNRSRRTFLDTVLKGHSKAVEEMENEIVMREAGRIEELESKENVLLSSLLPLLQSKVIANSRLIPVGSAITGLASSHSDLDVVLFPTAKNARDEFTRIIHANDGLKYEFISVLRATIVKRLHELGDDRFEVEDCHIIPLRVPLVICQFTNGTSVDISIPDATFQSIRNTHLMREYIKLDPRVSRLFLWLRAWSTALEIRDSKIGLLSSYHLLMLLIHFLHTEQGLSVPVLPVLYQTHSNQFHKDIPIENIVDRLNEPPNIDWKSKNRMNTAELVIRFLDFYSRMNILAKNIYIDKGMARDRMNAVTEAAAIYDPYSTYAACRSVNALRAFKDGIEFTQGRMMNGFMFNPFSPSSDSSFENFIQFSHSREWKMGAVKYKIKMTKDKKDWETNA